MQTPAERESSSGDRIGPRVRRVCDAVGDFIEYWGFKAIHGRIWTAVALHARPMAQTEIAEFLGVSRSLVSGAVAELVQHGLLRAESEHRNAPYEAVVDIWPTVSSILRTREWMLIERARMALEAAIEEIELAPGPERARYSLERMRFLLRMTELAQAFLRLLISIRVPRKLDGLGDWLKSSAKFIRSLREIR